MMIKTKPTSPGQRHRVKEDFSMLTKKRPERSLLVPWKKSVGRASSGRISTRHHGGGVKQLYRLIEFGRFGKGQPAKVVAIEYDPYRTAFIALLELHDNSKQYVLAPQDIKVGDVINCDEKTENKVGNRMRMKNIPVGTTVYNIEIEPDQGGKMVRSAGSFAIVQANENGYTNLKMPSGEIRRINQECFATIGALSRPEHKYVRLGKAGRMRYKGVRPRVRGTAMNPPDHPHGGGEGRTQIGMPAPKTPWGKIARGVKTRSRKHTDRFILSRRKK